MTSDEIREAINAHLDKASAALVGYPYVNQHILSRMAMVGAAIACGMWEVGVNGDCYPIFDMWEGRQIGLGPSGGVVSLRASLDYIVLTVNVGDL